MAIRKSFAIVAILFVFADAIAQQAQVFKMQYLPGLVYTCTQNTTSLTTIDFTGDKTELDKLPFAQLPVIIQNRSSLKYTLTTGAQNIKKFSGTVLINNSSNTQKLNGQEVALEPDSINKKTFTGIFNNGSFKVDSVKYIRATDSLKKFIAVLINGVKIDFPVKPLKSGDTFSQDVPVNLPIDGKPLFVNTHLIYKLTDIKNNGAFFEVNQTADLKIHTDKGDMEITGNGNGQIFYDTKYSFSRALQNNLTLKFTVKTDKLTMNGTTNIFSVYQNDIKAN